MLDLALAGTEKLCRLQAEVLAQPYPGELPEPSPRRKSKAKS
jgi:ribonuclease PH